MTQPFIVIGMHRSGTTLVTHLLQQMGVHMSWRLESNAESLFFLSLNRWMFRVAGAAWDHPEPMQTLLNKPTVRAKVTDYLQSVLNSPRVIEQMGIGAYLRHQKLDQQKRTWGWKDPRTIWTLPVWLSIFPEAKVIHVYRHGVDVALSLAKRSQDDLERDRNWISTAYHVATKERILKLVHSAGCLDLQFGFDLWAEYVQTAQQGVALTQNHLTLCYETLLQNPQKTIRQLADFVESSNIPSIDLNPERAFAFRENPVGIAFYEQVANHSLLQELGY